MKFKHKLFFATVMLFSISLRYPKSYLEKGSDSFGNHLISQAVIDNGNDQRVLNLFSFFGLFPGSNNMGGSFLLSAFSILTDLTIHQSIFILPILLSIIGSFSMFLFTRETTTNVTICLFAVLLFATARYYLAFTQYTYSYRMIYLSLLPVFLFLFIKLFKMNFRPHGFWIIIFFLSLALFSIHRMAYLNGLLVLSVILYYISKFLSRRVKITNKNKFLRPSIIICLFIILYISSIYGYFFYSGSSEYSLERGKRFFDSDSLHFTIINLGLLYAMQFGFLLPFSVLGLATILFRKKAINNYLVLVTLSYSMIWTDLTYGSFAFLPVIVVLVSLGLESCHSFLSQRISKATTYSLFMVVILSLQASPEFFTVKESEYTYVDKDAEYSRDLEYTKAFDAGLYIKSNNANDRPILSHIVSNTRISVYSESPSPINTEIYPNSIYYDYETIDIMVFLTGSVNHLYVITDDTLVRSYRYGVLLSGYNWDNDIHKTNINYIFRGDNEYILAVYDNQPYTMDEDSGQRVKSMFLYTATSQNYKFYDNGFHNLYYIDYD